MLHYVYMSVELPYSIFIHWKYSISRNKNGMTYVMHYGMISSFFQSWQTLQHMLFSKHDQGLWFVLTEAVLHKAYTRHEESYQLCVSLWGNIAPDRNYF